METMILQSTPTPQDIHHLIHGDSTSISHQLKSFTRRAEFPLDLISPLVRWMANEITFFRTFKTPTRRTWDGLVFPSSVLCSYVALHFSIPGVYVCASIRCTIHHSTLGYFLPRSTSEPNVGVCLSRWLLEIL
jgi:hypothetical protein